MARARATSASALGVVGADSRRVMACVMAKGPESDAFRMAARRGLGVDCLGGRPAIHRQMHALDSFEELLLA